MVNVLKEILKVHDYLEEVGPFCGEVSDRRAGVPGEGQMDRPGPAPQKAAPTPESTLKHTCCNQPSRDVTGDSQLSGHKENCPHRQPRPS